VTAAHGVNGNPPAAGRDVVRILGVPVDRVTMAGALARIETFIQEDRPHLVFTPNPEMLDRAVRDPGLTALFERADLSIADGVLVVLASRWMGRPVPERVTGIDLAGEVLARAAGRGWTVFLLGGRPGVAARAAARVAELYPGVRVAGTRDGYFSDDAAAEVAAGIRATGALIVVVGMGAPRQERWMAAHGAACGARVLIGVGGSLDVLAGEVARAPVWVRRLNLEWLYRLARQPSRWRRMAALPRFAWAAWSRRRSGRE
jgi:N-acetylglucosaminyldiphosphoundecaprenol N-acetyl-beta-D-mannosaminyltransferase